LQKVCRTVVFGELDWSPGVHSQCVGRVYRDGQEDPVVAYFLLSDEGSDPVISDALGLKKTQIEGVVDPTAELTENVESPENGIRRLAEAVMRSQDKKSSLDKLKSDDSIHSEEKKQQTPPEAEADGKAEGE
jgi:hypothetical protein